VPRDLYSILGVNRNASKEEIKSAYRRLSKELHPDRNKGNKETEQRFKEVNEAYEVLSDDKKRQMYDQFGTTGGPGGGGAGPFGGFDFSGFSGGEFGGFGDLFETFFGGRRAGGGRSSSERGRDIEVEVEVELGDVVKGASRTLSLDREGVCSACDGSGAERGSKMIPCRECGGTGQVTRTTQSFFGTFRQTTICPTCGGARNIPERVCRTCKGEGRTRERKTVTVNVPAGVQDGQTLRVRGEGEAGVRKSASGDLYVHVRVLPDRRFERDGDDVRTSISLPVIDVILGTDISVETVRGSVTLKVPAGTQPSQVFRLKGKGMPILNSSRMGDHYVTVNVEVPTRLSRAEQKILEEWRKLRE
jgi:molecular chaperone DnaJ